MRLFTIQVCEVGLLYTSCRFNAQVKGEYLNDNECTKASYTRVSYNILSTLTHKYNDT